MECSFEKWGTHTQFKYITSTTVQLYDIKKS